jgi:hypothetical protein
MNRRTVRRVAVWFVIVAAWWCLSRTSPVSSPGSVFGVPPIRITRTLIVAPGAQSDLQVSFPSSKTPGWLRGAWTVRDTTSNARGAHDDSLVGFVLTGPNGKIIQNRDHPISGNFAERYKGGNYTFTFDNAGWVRSSSRIVTFEGTYQPD